MNHVGCGVPISVLQCPKLLSDWPVGLTGALEPYPWGFGFLLLLLSRPRSCTIYVVHAQALPLLSVLDSLAIFAEKAFFSSLCRAAFVDEYVGHYAADFVYFTSSS